MARNFFGCAIFCYKDCLLCLRAIEYLDGLGFLVKGIFWGSSRIGSLHLPNVFFRWNNNHFGKQNHFIYIIFFRSSTFLILLIPFYPLSYALALLMFFPVLCATISPLIFHQDKALLDYQDSSCMVSYNNGWVQNIQFPLPFEME